MIVTKTTTNGRDIMASHYDEYYEELAREARLAAKHKQEQGGKHSNVDSESTTQKHKVEITVNLTISTSDNH